jgi:hypothetical protein
MAVSASFGVGAFAWLKGWQRPLGCVFCMMLVVLEGKAFV